SWRQDLGLPWCGWHVRRLRHDNYGERAALREWAPSAAPHPATYSLKRSISSRNRASLYHNGTVFSEFSILLIADRVHPIFLANACWVIPNSDLFRRTVSPTQFVASYNAVKCFTSTT